MKKDWGNELREFICYKGDIDNSGIVVWILVFCREFFLLLMVFFFFCDGEDGDCGEVGDWLCEGGWMFVLFWFVGWCGRDYFVRILFLYVVN